MSYNDMERIKMKKESIIFLFIISIILLCYPISAFNITIDEKTENSITWNLTEIGSYTIVSASFDGINITDISPTTKILIQSDLTARTGHILTIIDSSGETSSKNAITSVLSLSENEKFYASINMYIFVILALICAAIGAFIPLIGFATCIFAVLGLLSSFNNSVAMALLCMILLIVGIIDCING
jgi:hypothetical protein